MDECRFDNWTRMLGAIQDRRTALKEATAAGAALVALAKADLGFAQEDDEVQIEACGRENESCRRNSQCCSGKCKRRRRRRRGGRNNDGRNNDGRGRRRDRDGRCTCLKSGRNCNKDAACCKGRCDPNDRRCRCVPANDICNRDDDCCGNRRCNNGFCGN